MGHMIQLKEWDHFLLVLVVPHFVDTLKFQVHVPEYSLLAYPTHQHIQVMELALDVFIDHK